VLRLQREVRWIEAFRRANPGAPPTASRCCWRRWRKMLAQGRKPQSLSTASTRSHPRQRLPAAGGAARPQRYLIGLLIFLGLLGTFWGLLITIGSVAEIIAGLSAGSDALAMFERSSRACASRWAAWRPVSRPRCSAWPARWCWA
jgi:hypothetical protein